MTKVITMSGRTRLLTWILLLTAFFLSACSEEEYLPDNSTKTDDKTSSPAVNETNQYVNSWILENMQYWYLWNDELSENADKNLDPESYFSSILDNQDRFSWIQSNYKELLNSLQGISKEAGYEFILYQEKEASNNVILQVVYTKPGSPAATAGLKRGDIITHINGQRLMVSNYRTVLDAVKENHTIQYQSLLIDEQKFGEAKEVSLSAIAYSENPNYLHKVIDMGGKKIGYFVYNFFASGTDDEPRKYDLETDAVFSHFKAAGITDLVIDLRYNSGGSEVAARNLASLIGRGVNESQIFLKRQYNDFVQQAIINDEKLGRDFLVTRYITKENNVGNQLSSGRVYILTSARTASASELVINALRPFMEVFLIGDTTYGKNVGSISLYEEDDPKNTWGIQPIVVKVSNSLDQSDYSAGFVPDVLYKDHGLFIYPLGDAREALLAKAIAQITGTGTTAREVGQQRTVIGHSLDLKRRSYNLIMEH